MGAKRTAHRLHTTLVSEAAAGVQVTVDAGREMVVAERRKHWERGHDVDASIRSENSALVRCNEKLIGGDL
jgi:hypothetical protein